MGVVGRGWGIGAMGCWVRSGWEIGGQWFHRHGMAFGLLRVAMQVTDLSTVGCRVLEPERFHVFVYLDHIVFVARFGANDIAGLDVILAVLAFHLRFAFEDQPVLVAIMVMAIKSRASLSDPKNPGAGDLRPFG